MFEIYRGTALAGGEAEHSAQSQALIAHRRITNLYSRAHSAGVWRAIWGKLLGRDYNLRTLPRRHQAVGLARIPQLQAVPLAQIVGSENRSNDFDRAFAPLQEHTESRWLSVAMAWELGHSLPAVELIQLGHDYYVRDGHHRISVARAYGQHEIDAVVLVWQAEPTIAVAPELCVATV